MPLRVQERFKDRNIFKTEKRWPHRSALPSRPSRKDSSPDRNRRSSFILTCWLITPTMVDFLSTWITYSVTLLWAANFFLSRVERLSPVPDKRNLKKRQGRVSKNCTYSPYNALLFIQFITWLPQDVPLPLSLPWNPPVPPLPSSLGISHILY